VPPRIEELADRLQAGDRRALARLLTLVDDGGPERLREIVQRLHPTAGTARTIGVTGSPGVGKSTITDAITTQLRAQGRQVAILAVDPSSPFSGGALLGDRVRMQAHHADDGVFIRSMAARGHLGGLSVATPHAVLVLDAAGFDDVIVETVGVGQSEVEVAATADTTVVALAPNMGDSIQAAKAGILEVADVFAINKSDHPGAGKLEAELRGMIELGHAAAGDDADDDRTAGWWPPIVRTVAVRAEGIAELVTAIEEHGTHLRDAGLGQRRREARALHTVREIALEQVRRRFAHPDDGADVLLERLAAEVVARDLDPYAAADQLLDAFDTTDRA
jgi:LAO/AO transport system kinase